MQLEKDLTSLRVEGQDLKLQINRLYGSLSNLTGRPLVVPEVARMEGNDREGEKDIGEGRLVGSYMYMYVRTCIYFFNFYYSASTYIHLHVHHLLSSPFSF